MPRQIDYPRSSLKAALEVAEAVFDLGGVCSYELCAEKLNKSPKGGSYNAQTSSAIKFGFIVRKKGDLTITDLYKSIHLAYTKEERENLLRESFLKIPVYKTLFDKFKYTKLPTDVLDKLLIREFSINTNDAIRVSNYFVKDAKMIKLLNENGEFIYDSSQSNASDKKDQIPEKSFNDVKEKEEENSPIAKSSNYIIKVNGPDMNLEMQILSKDDIVFIETALQMIKRKLEENI